MGAISGSRLLACVGLELIVLTGTITYLAMRDPFQKVSQPQQQQHSAAAAAVERQRAAAQPRDVGRGGVAGSRIVHQSWKTARLPVGFSRWRASWRACFPGWRHLLWTDEMNAALVRRAVPWFHDTYTRKLAGHPICRADAARYVYMHEFGGIYSDLDSVCQRSFEHLLRGCDILVGAMQTLRGPADPFGYYENSFLYSAVPGHPLWTRLLRDVQANAALAAATPMIPEEICGPIALTRALRAAVLRAARDSASGNQSSVWGRICLAPPDQFNPFSWVTDNLTAGPCRDLNRMTASEEVACQRKHRSAFVLQFHTQLWKSGRLPAATFGGDDEGSQQS